MEVAKLSAPPNLQVRSVSCNESATKRWLSSELEETVFSLTHELFMTNPCIVSLSQTGVGEWNDPRSEMTRGSFYPSVCNDRD